MHYMYSRLDNVLVRDRILNSDNCLLSRVLYVYIYIG